MPDRSEVWARRDSLSRSLEAWALLTWGPIRRRLRSFGAKEMARLAAFAALGLLFVSAEYGALKAGAAYVWSRPELGPVLGERLLCAAFGVLFLFGVFSAAAAFAGRLASAPDAAFWVAGPADPATHFRVRVLQTGASLFGAWALVWAPLVMALRAAWSSGMAFLFWGFLVTLPILALALALGSACACVALRMLSPRRLRAGMAGLSAFGVVACLLALRALGPERLADPERARSAAEYLAGLPALDPPWWPGTWAGKALAEGAAAPASALAWWLLAVAAAGAALWSLDALASAEAHDLWARWSSGAERVRGAGGSAFQGSARSAFGLLLEMEWIRLRRAPGFGVQVLLMAGLTSLFALSLARLPFGNDQSLKEWLFLPVCGTAQWILVAAGARFVFPGPSLEASRSWLTRLSPAPLKTELAARAVLGILVLGVPALALAVAVARSLSPGPVALALEFWIFAESTVFLACFFAGLGTAWTRGGTRRAEEILGSTEGVLAMMAGIALVVCSDLGVLPALREAAVRTHQASARIHLGAAGAALALSALLQAGAVVWAWGKGLKRIDAGE